MRRREGEKIEGDGGDRRLEREGEWRERRSVVVSDGEKENGRE